MFIELSSVKTYHWGDYVTQRNCVAKAAGLKAPVVDKVLLQALPDSELDEARARLDGFSSRLQNEEGIIGDLDAAIRALPRGHIVLVNHFVLDRDDMPGLHIRRDLRKLCDRIAALYPDRVTRFDPTPELASLNFPIANPGHYLDVFKPVLAERFGALIDTVMRKRAAG